MSKKNIIAFDLGRRAGWAQQVDGKYSAGSFICGATTKNGSNPKSCSVGEMLSSFSVIVRDLLSRETFDCVVVEAEIMPGLTKIDTLVPTYSYHGLLEMICFELGIANILTVRPTEWKKAVLLNGAADRKDHNKTMSKASATEWAKKFKANVSFPIGPDTADAINVLRWALHFIAVED